MSDKDDEQVKVSPEKVLPEEELKQLKQHILASLSAKITLTEVVQIMNSMLINEVEQRILEMSEEDLINNSNELKESLEKSEQEDSEKPSE